MPRETDAAEHLSDNGNPEADRQLAANFGMTIKQIRDFDPQLLDVTRSCRFFGLPLARFDQLAGQPDSRAKWVESVARQKKDLIETFPQASKELKEMLEAIRKFALRKCLKPDGKAQLEKDKAPGHNHDKLAIALKIGALGAGITFLFFTFNILYNAFSSPPDSPKVISGDPAKDSTAPKPVEVVNMPPNAKDQDKTNGSSKKDVIITENTPGSTASSPPSKATNTQPIVKSKDLINSMGMKLVLIPKGKFIMGSPATEIERGVDETPHEITHENDFYMGIHEVTQDAYEKLMKENPSIFKGKNLPVENVSWEGARTFCRKLSELSEEKNTGGIIGFPQKRNGNTPAVRERRQPFIPETP